ncbi:hypothetical protein PDE_07644 [Penicillium oxalicum 114-2]|uniref:Uncharacterized protein n=1 Tax=Penicillium oxalicum (strain 114-2 / CGMCC 5302) TaxID=933388 RepID=S7ZQJ6_PENO1|nr:hypothetical protein PDE_07644 [Penicillium oxalicum 114-2]
MRARIFYCSGSTADSDPLIY